MEGILGLAILIAIIVGFVLLVQKIYRRATGNKHLAEIKVLEERKTSLKNDILSNEKELEDLKTAYLKLDAETKELQELKAKTNELEINFQENEAKNIQAKQEYADTIELINSIAEKKIVADKTIASLQSKIDLYSRLDDFVGYGFYDTPDYLYETSERFAIEIKAVRDKQKELIKDDDVIVQTGKNNFNINLSFIEKILQAQKKLLIRTFNIECDFLIEKVNPANFERTLNRITSLASELEKLSADLRYGFNQAYIELKLEECKLQFQFQLKKKEEQEEQRLIKEQMREEEKARREYEAQMVQAEKEEKLYQNLLERARTELEKTSNEERQQALLKIQTLEQELAEAKAKSERAKSMAEQTRRGHIYIISNIGSFGENIYKIGMTRRLDPMDRIKELGDASVPFSFDVHAMIYSEDAPRLENELHKTFHNNRVNAINLKKEFFHVSLEKIKEETERLTNNTAEFTMTILADEYYQTQRLRHN